MVSILIFGGSTIIGAAVLYWSRELAVRYNDWTTGFRGRHPNFNPAPTPTARKLNEEIMTWLFRVLGAFVALLSMLWMVSLRNAN
jgi:hypothetical protein